MLTLRYIIRLVKAFIIRFRVILIIGVLIGVASFVFIRYFGKYLLPGNVEKIGVVGRYHSDNLPFYILSMIGDGLTKTTESGLIQPDIASSWETPDKGKTWIFHLNQGKFWQDGKAVTSQNLVYEFSDVSIDRLDEKTIVFKLQSPFSPFPSAVSRPTFRKGLLGTGKWRVKKIIIAGSFVQQLTLVDKNKNQKIIKFYPTEERAKLAFKLGEIDTLSSIFSQDPFNTWKTVTIEKSVNLNQYAAVFFNTQDKVLSEKNLRQALSYAIDKEAFDGPRAIGPISPSSWAFNPQVKPYTFDKTRAKELINALSKEQKENLSLKLVTTPFLLPVGEKIAKFWKEVGVNSSLQVSSGLPTDYQALLAIVDIPQDPDQYALWHSTQTETNISHYKNPRIDKLLEDGRAVVNIDERRKLYLDLQRFLVEDSPAVFLYQPVSYTIKRK